jgi:hypothetical protein
VQPRFVGLTCATLKATMTCEVIVEGLCELTLKSWIGNRPGSLPALTYLSVDILLLKGPVRSTPPQWQKVFTRKQKTTISPVRLTPV